MLFISEKETLKEVLEDLLNELNRTEPWCKLVWIDKDESDSGEEGPAIVSMGWTPDCHSGTKWVHWIQWSFVNSKGWAQEAV